MYKWLISHANKLRKGLISRVDKVVHVTLSFFIVAWLSLILPVEVSVIILLLLGYGKEVVDSLTDGNCDGYDEVANMVGAILAIIYLAL